MYDDAHMWHANGVKIGMGHWQLIRLIRWLVIGMLALGLASAGVLLALTVPPARASVHDGAFHITLAGQVSASQSQSGSNGGHVITVAQQLQAASGQYPNVLLQMNLTETVAANHAGKLTGTATLADATGQTTLFTTAVIGDIQTSGVATYQLSGAQAETGTGGALTWQGNFRATRTGALSGAAQGTLLFPAGIAASTRNAIWPGAAATTTGAANDDPTLWYLTRGAASAAYVVLVITTALGMGISTQAFDSVTQRWRVLDLHQVLTLLMLALVALHLITLVFDPFLPFSVANLIWPVGEPFHALYTALGVIGLYTLAIVTISSWVRRWLDYRTWRALHYVSAFSFVLLTLHGIFTGTDSTTAWMTATYVTSVLLIVALLLLRLAQAFTRSRQRQATLHPLTRR